MFLYEYLQGKIASFSYKNKLIFTQTSINAALRRYMEAHQRRMKSA